MMPKMSIAYGLALVVLGLIGYTQGVPTPPKTAVSPTALIPAFLGIAAILAGIGSIIIPKLRMHLMHVAAVVGLIGALSIVMFFITLSKKGMALGPAMQLLTALFSIGFLALCVQSFRKARREKAAAYGAESAESA